MAISSTYYLNAPSLGSATAVFTNADLTIIAADGFYSDGIISREQVSGVLLPQQTCPACATPCGETINASGGQGIYLLDLETGTTVADIGAVIVRFDPYGVPDGIRATLGSSVYNKLTSPVDGLHQSSNAGALTYIGQISADCGISGTTYPALIEYSYNGTTFVATGNTQSVTVAPGDVSLGASAPGSTMMVIPKLTPSPSIINFEVVGPCSGTAWQMSVDCPVLLTGFSSSVVAATSEAVCLLAETTTYYNASLANTPGTVGLYDFVFADAYGQTPLTVGFYYAAGSITGGNDWFEVNSGGVVITLGVCVVPPVVSYNCISGNCIDPGDGSGAYSTLEACESICGGTPTVTSVGGYMQPCVGGTIDDYMGASVSVDLPVDVDSTFEVSVKYVLPGNSCGAGESTQSIYPIILSGQTSSNFDACLNGVYFSSGAVICGACIVSCDNPSVNLSTSACTPSPAISYNCVSGNCVDPGDGTGTYSTLGACQSACPPPPVPVWYELSKCSDSSVLYSEEYIQGDFSINERVTIPGSIVCIVVAEFLSAPVGTLYAITTTGQTGCPPPPVSYNCVSGNCVDPGDGTGIYPTLIDCEAVCTPPASATLNWTFTETSATGAFDLYVNGSVVESRSVTSSGTYTVYEGDTINVEINTTGCNSPDIKANAYCIGIIADAACADNAVNLFTAVYTVVSGDLGTTLTLNTFALCDTACI